MPLATASFETDYIVNGLSFAFDSDTNTRSVTINKTGGISQASGGIGDPLVAVGNLFGWPLYQAIYDFTASGAKTVVLTSTGTNVVSAKNATTGDLLTGLTTAFSLDVSDWNGTTGTGTISWNPVTNLALTPAGTALNSATLNAFDLGSTASMTMSFAITSGVYNFVTGAFC